MTTPTLAQRYVARIHDGFEADQSQRSVVSAFERLGNQIAERDRRIPWFKAIWRGFRPNKTPIKGIYIWGGVGRGKTFLMDLFFEWLPVKAKRRIHFHRFMSDVHRQLHALKGTKNPLDVVASRIASETKVLCFDEFFVIDIGDAMILGETLRGLLERDVVLVATSNTQPKDLYENGLQRSRFLPAIDLIERYTQVIHLDSSQDYRLDHLKRGELYRVNYPVAQEDVREDIQNLTDGEVDVHSEIEILGRNIRCEFTGDGVIGFKFDQLCKSPRSASDYVELSRLFHTVVLYDLPELTAGDDGAVRRFIHLIDEFYDRNVNMVFRAQRPITEIYVGELLRSDFERAVSRISEMQSDQYLSKAHKG